MVLLKDGNEWLGHDAALRRRMRAATKPVPVPAMEGIKPLSLERSMGTFTCAAVIDGHDLESSGVCGNSIIRPSPGQGEGRTFQLLREHLAKQFSTKPEDIDCNHILYRMWQDRFSDSSVHPNRFQYKLAAAPASNARLDEFTDLRWHPAPALRPPAHCAASSASASLHCASSPPSRLARVR